MDMMKSKKGFFQNLSSMAIYIVIFAVVIVVGSVVLANLGNAIGGSANTTAQNMITNLGTTNGGLGSWTTAVIALGIGVLFIGALAGGFMRKKGY